MNKATSIKRLLLAALLLAQGFMVGCGKKCQAPAVEAFKSIKDTEWRLVETTDPTVKTLNRFTFTILSFSVDFGGAVKKVVNNREYDTPILTFIWNIDTTDSRNGKISTQFSTVAPDPNTPDGSGQGQVSTGPTVIYNYTLGRELELTDQSHGYYYRYVPFVGVVDPDSVCTF